jgi:hypothetical protein
MAAWLVYNLVLVLWLNTTMFKWQIRKRLEEELRARRRKEERWRAQAEAEADRNAHGEKKA